MPVGIMQGRLSNKVGKPLQSFPWDSWQEEFARAAETGFDLIEWLVDGEHDEKNPIATESGRDEIKYLMAEYKVGVRSLCAHTFIDGALLKNGNSSLVAVNHLKDILNYSAEIGIEFVVLPVMDAMSLRSKSARDGLKKILRSILSESDPFLLLESDLPGSELAAFVDEVNSPKLGVLYDFGNANAMGFNIVEDISILGSRIREIHIKDRVHNNGPSHRLGEGDTLFLEGIQALAQSSWQGPVVLETPIFNNWKLEAVHNLAFTRDCLVKVNQKA